MAKRQKMWVYSPPRPAKPKVPESLKADVQARANELAETVLKPEHIKPPPADEDFNYKVDLYTKWHGSSLYFCARYHSPGPNAISPYFDTRFTRMEYAGGDRFNLAYMRYTRKWHEMYAGLTVDECLAKIREFPHFWP